MDIETTKLTQELAVKLEQGETFISGTQWQTEKLEGETLCGKSEDGKSPSEQDWGNQSSTLGLYILSRGLHLCTLDLQISCVTVHEESMRSIA